MYVRFSPVLAKVGKVLCEIFKIVVLLALGNIVHHLCVCVRVCVVCMCVCVSHGGGAVVRRYYVVWLQEARRGTRANCLIRLP